MRDQCVLNLWCFGTFLAKAASEMITSDFFGKSSFKCRGLFFKIYTGNVIRNWVALTKYDFCRTKMNYCFDFAQMFALKLIIQGQNEGRVIKSVLLDHHCYRNHSF